MRFLRGKLLGCFRTQRRWGSSSSWKSDHHIHIQLRLALGNLLCRRFFSQKRIPGQGLERICLIARTNWKYKMFLRMHIMNSKHQLKNAWILENQLVAIAFSISHECWDLSWNFRKGLPILVVCRRKKSVEEDFFPFWQTNYFIK